MTPEQLDAIAKLGDAIQRIGVVGIMIGIGLLFYKKKLKLGSDFEAAATEAQRRFELLAAEKDEWKSIALTGFGVADRATTVAAAAAARVRKVEHPPVKRKPAGSRKIAASGGTVNVPSRRKRPTPTDR